MLGAFIYMVEEVLNIRVLQAAVNLILISVFSNPDMSPILFS